MKPKILNLLLISAVGLVLVAPVSIVEARNIGGVSQDFIKDKFLQKQRRIIKNRDALGLSLKQVQKIEALKINLEKEQVLLDAKIQVINIDLKSMLSKDNIDMKSVSDLIRQKYEYKQTKAKAQAMAYANLKKILNSDQLKKLNNLREIYRGPYRTTAE